MARINGKADMSSSTHKAASWRLDGEGVMFARFLSLSPVSVKRSGRRLIC